MKLNITYMSGAGNLFTVINNRLYDFDEQTLSKLAIELCNINSVNKMQTDGLLAIDRTNDTDFIVYYYNPDGSSGMMCGNGARCAVYYAAEVGFIKKVQSKTVNFKMANRIYSSEFSNDAIKLYLPAPSEITQELEIKTDFGLIPYNYINVNTEHICINYNKLSLKTSFSNFKIEEFAKPIRFHPDFQPKGANVNFYVPSINRNLVLLRTYERGVERETAACGTGTIASAIACVLAGFATFPVNVIPKSGEQLIVDIIGNFPFNIEAMILEGPAIILDKKEININTLEFNYDGN